MSLPVDNLQPGCLQGSHAEVYFLHSPPDKPGLLLYVTRTSYEHAEYTVVSGHFPPLVPQAERRQWQEIYVFTAARSARTVMVMFSDQATKCLM